MSHPFFFLKAVIRRSAKLMHWPEKLYYDALKTEQIRSTKVDESERPLKHPINISANKTLKKPQS